MTQRRRVKLSAMQRNDMWSRWKAGQSLHEIGRAFSKDHVSIQFMLAQHGGIAPAVRRRSPLTLTLAEREEISRGIASGGSIREIAKGLKRAVSTVSREIKNAGLRDRFHVVSSTTFLRISGRFQRQRTGVSTPNIEDSMCGKVYRKSDGRS